MRELCLRPIGCSEPRQVKIQFDFEGTQKYTFEAN